MAEAEEALGRLKSNDFTEKLWPTQQIRVVLPDALPNHLHVVIDKTSVTSSEYDPMSPLIPTLIHSYRVASCPNQPARRYYRGRSFRGQRSRGRCSRFLLDNLETATRSLQGQAASSIAIVASSTFSFQAAAEECNHSLCLSSPTGSGTRGAVDITPPSLCRIRSRCQNDYPNPPGLSHGRFAER